MKIVEVGPGNPTIQTLVEAHREYCAEHTPRGSGHAVDASAAATDVFRYFLATDEGVPIGCVGLQAISEDEAEIKTMHVVSAARGKGSGERLLRWLIDLARREGYERLFLETGRSEGFAASRRLYARLGFEACDPFGKYAGDPFSYCMTRSLADS